METNKIIFNATISVYISSNNGFLASKLKLKTLNMYYDWINITFFD